MSVRVMSLVWSLDLPDSQKIVLLALADCANDEGHCWPSMATLAKKCSKGERTVQGVIKQLCDAGHITRKENPGKGCNYYLHPGATPAAAAPRSDRAPQPSAATPAASADKPSRTIINGLADAKPIRAIKRKGWPVIPDWIPAEPWNGFITMRDRKRASPTPRAITLLIAKLDGLRAKGHDPGSILDISTERSWTGLFEPKDDHHGHSRNVSVLPASNSRGTRPDRCLDMLRFSQTPDDPEAYFGDDQPAWPPLPAIGSG